jgi:hypothetical protein
VRKSARPRELTAVYGTYSERLQDGSRAGKGRALRLLSAAPVLARTRKMSRSGTYLAQRPNEAKSAFVFEVLQTIFRRPTPLLRRLADAPITGLALRGKRGT